MILGPLLSLMLPAEIEPLCSLLRKRNRDLLLVTDREFLAELLCHLLSVGMIERRPGTIGHTGRIERATEHCERRGW